MNNFVLATLCFLSVISLTKGRITNCYDELISGKKVRCKNIFYYTARQCNEHNKCRCVISKTGTTIPGLSSVPMRFKCKNVEHTVCQKTFIRTELKNFRKGIKNGENVQCRQKNGHFTQRQCSKFNKKCSCVVSQTGTPIPGLTDVNLNYKCKNADLSLCQQQFIKVNLLNHKKGYTFHLPDCSFEDQKDEGGSGSGQDDVSESI